MNTESGGESVLVLRLFDVFFLQRAVRVVAFTYIYTMYLLLGYEALGCVLGFSVLDNMSCFGFELAT